MAGDKKISQLPSFTTPQSGDLLVMVNDNDTKHITFANFMAGVSGANNKVAVDAEATAGFLGATGATGVIRVSSPLTYADGGNWVTIGLDQSQIDHTAIASIGVYTHVQIDSHIDNTNNPHGVTHPQLGVDETNADHDGRYLNLSGEFGEQVFIDFDLTPGVVGQEGRLYWNEADGTLNLGMPGGDVNLQVGQEQLVRVKNTSGVTIGNGKAVYISGATGAFPTIGLADATNHIIANATIAVATEEIADNQFGYVTTFGLVRDVDTSWATADGTPGFLSTTPGVLTNTLPTQPDSQVFVAVVIKKHATEGVLFIKVIPQPNLDELSNVFISSIADGDILQWVDANSRYENVSISSLLDPWFATKTTDDLAEGTVNFYYTETRFDTSFAGKTTDDLAEGATNKYWDYDADNQRIIRVATPVDGTDAVNKDFVMGLIGGIDWQDSVLDKDLTAPPSSPGTGDRYIVGVGATGAWSGHDNDIAEWNGTSWDFTTPNEGFACWVEDENVIYVYNGSWVKMGTVIDHGNLLGLGDDDHSQYHTDARALIWLGTRSTTDLPEGTNLYYTQARFDTAFGLKTTDALSEGAVNFYYTEARFDTSFGGKDTDDLSEGAINFYYTEARFNASFSGKDTDGLSEGLTNLYFTNERVDDRVANLLVAGIGIAIVYDDVANTLTITNTSVPLPTYWQRTGTILHPLTSGDTLQIGDGSVSVPGYSWEDDPDTGLYRQGANKMAVSLGGVGVMDFFSASSLILGGIGSVAGTTVDFQFNTATPRMRLGLSWLVTADVATGGALLTGNTSPQTDFGYNLGRSNLRFSSILGRGHQTGAVFDAPLTSANFYAFNIISIANGSASSGIGFRDQAIVSYTSVSSPFVVTERYDQFRAEYDLDADASSGHACTVTLTKNQYYADIDLDERFGGTIDTDGHWAFEYRRTMKVDGIADGFPVQRWQVHSIGATKNRYAGVTPIVGALPGVPDMWLFTFDYPIPVTESYAVGCVSYDTAIAYEELGFPVFGTLHVHPTLDPTLKTSMTVGGGVTYIIFDALGRQVINPATGQPGAWNNFFQLIGDMRLSEAVILQVEWVLRLTDNQEMDHVEAPLK